MSGRNIKSANTTLEEEDLRQKRSAENKRKHEKILSDPEKLQHRKNQLKKNYEARKARAAAAEGMLEMSSARAPTVSVRDKRSIARVQRKKREKNRERRKKWDKTYYTKKKMERQMRAANLSEIVPEIDQEEDKRLIQETKDETIQKYRAKYFMYQYVSFEEFMKQFPKKKIKKYFAGESTFCNCEGNCEGCDNVGFEEECDELTCNVIRTIKRENKKSKVQQKEKCMNKWSSQYWAINDCVPAHENGMGIGLKAVSSIQEGNVIAPYTGRLYIQRDREGEYTMHAGGATIDAKKKGNNTRFINQCCKNRVPNCAARKRRVWGQETFWIVAIKDIKRGEFLCFDYEPDANDTDDPNEMSKWQLLRLNCGCDLCVCQRAK